MSTVNEDVEAGRPILMPQLGVVTRVDDPAGRHRVKASVDGLIDETQWAYPLTVGGGGPQRGGHVVPAVGSDVVLIFMGGDPERPFYAPAHWSKEELPADLQGLPAAEAHLVQTLEIGRYKITVDERPGKEQLSVQDKGTGDLVQLDGTTGGVLIKATTALRLQCDGAIDVEALSVTLNGRPLLADDKPI